MKLKYEIGQTVYLIASARIVREATVIKHGGDMYTIRFTDGGGMRARESRLYATREEAEAQVVSNKDRERARIIKG